MDQRFSASMVSLVHSSTTVRLMQTLSVRRSHCPRSPDQLTVVEVLDDPLLNLFRALALRTNVQSALPSNVICGPELTSVAGTARIQQYLRLIMIFPRSSVPRSKDALPPVKYPPASVTMTIPACRGNLGQRCESLRFLGWSRSYSNVPSVWASIPRMTAMAYKVIISSTNGEVHFCPELTSINQADQQRPARG
jgi:hypothetical protein